MKEIIKKRRLESSVFIYLPKGFRPVRFRKPDRSPLGKVNFDIKQAFV